MMFRIMIPSTSYKNIRKEDLKSNPKIESMSFYCFLYLSSFGTNICVILFRLTNKCSTYFLKHFHVEYMGLSYLKSSYSVTFTYL